MPEDAWLFFYDCKGCGQGLKPKPGDCCVFTCADGYLLGTGRKPKLVSAHRLVEEGLASAESEIELVFVDGFPTERFTIADVIRCGLT
jgi:hypothetical protein